MQSTRHDEMVEGTRVFELSAVSNSYSANFHLSERCRSADTRHMVGTESLSLNRSPRFLPVREGRIVSEPKEILECDTEPPCLVWMNINSVLLSFNICRHPLRHSSNVYLQSEHLYVYLDIHTSCSCISFVYRWEPGSCLQIPSSRGKV